MKAILLVIATIYFSPCFCQNATIKIDSLYEKFDSILMSISVSSSREIFLPIKTEPTPREELFTFFQYELERGDKGLYSPVVLSTAIDYIPYYLLLKKEKAKEKEYFFNISDTRIKPGGQYRIRFKIHYGRFNKNIRTTKYTSWYYFSVGL